MKINLDDRTLFGNDAGEDEDESILVSYFVNRPEFACMLALPDIPNTKRAGATLSLNRARNVSLPPPARG